MKVNGQTFDKPNVEYCVIPRTGKGNIVFTAQAITDYKEFNDLCPEPTPPIHITPENEKQPNLKDQTYQDAMQLHAERRMAWIIIKSLQATEGLEWDTVKYDDPKTWLNYEKDLQNNFFSQVEIQRIQTAVFAANCLDERRVKEARENFLAGLEAARGSTSGQNTERNSSQSGERAKG